VATADLNVTLEPRVEVLRYHSSESERRCERVKSVDELMKRLSSTAVLK
jgi:hypothetical protein